MMKSFHQPKHWQDPNSMLTSRLQYLPERLVISGVKLSDAGVYKCRVDYYLEQTSFQLVRLKVIVPPEPPNIFYRSKPVAGNTLHVKENMSVILVCESSGSDLVSSWEKGFFPTFYYYQHFD